MFEADRDREEGEQQVHKWVGSESHDTVSIIHRQECIPILRLFLKPPVQLREGQILSFW